MKALLIALMASFAPRQALASLQFLEPRDLEDVNGPESSSMVSRTTASEMLDSISN